MTKDTKKITEDVIKKLDTYIKRYEFNPKEYGMVEQKGGFDYISWSYCELLGNLIDPDFSWVAQGSDMFSDIPKGFVKVEMTFLGKKRTLLHPVLDFKNKSIENPTSFDTNKANMRGMSKLFSLMSGIGLSLYTGEDLPEETPKAQPVPQPKPQVNIQDMGNIGVSPFRPTQPPMTPINDLITEAQLKLVNTLIGRTGTDRNAVKANFKVASLKELNRAQTDQLIGILQSRVEGQ